jgi:hypothetical protein
MLTSADLARPPTDIIFRHEAGRWSSGPWQVIWPCPKLVSYSGGPFDPCETKR